MLHVYYTQADDAPASATAWSQAYKRLLARVPPGRRARLERFRNRTARLTSALGLLLLEHAMRRAGNDDFALSELIEPADRSKPYCPGRPDFNISHSRSIVYCALIDHGRVGVDVERVRPLKTGDFERMITARERDHCGGEAPFFQAWTRKEAALKAQGASAVWDMRQVRLNVSADTADFKGESWRLRSLPAPAGFVAAVAWRDGAQDIQCEFVDAQTLLIG